MGEFVKLTVEEGVATLRLDRPPANAIDGRVGRELGEAVRVAGEREDVGAAVIWGGPKIFAAGADIKEMADLGPEEIRPIVTALGDALAALEELPFPTIAAINGFALGGGCEAALAADLRYAAQDAQLGQPEVRIGVFPGAGGTQRLPRIVGAGRAKELLFTGRRVGAEEALAIGLVTRVLPPEDVYATAVRDARALARGPREALRAAKAALDRRAVSREGLLDEREAFIALFGTKDQREGMRAFLEKRDPEFG